MNSRPLFLILFILAFSAPLSATVNLALDDYTHWQGYNGWRIQVIVFPGIKSFSRAELLTVMATEKPTWLRRYVRIGSRTTFFADDFTADLFRVEHFYKREGFPQVVIRGEVRPREKYREVVLKIEITEGPPMILDGWRLELGDQPNAGVDSTRWAAALPIKVGERVAFSDLKSSADTLTSKLQQIGHARARVDFAIASDTVNNKARVTFLLYPGNYCRLGLTHFKGLKQLSEASARRELAYEEHDPFSPGKLEETRQRLVRLEIFNYVSVRADTSAPGDTLPVWIDMQEGWRYRVRTGLGYDTEEGPRVAGDFTDLNFFGRARRFTWSGSYSPILRKTEARLFWPHTPWNATDVTLAPKWEHNREAAFRLETISATTILSSSPLPKVMFSLSNEAGTAHRVDLTDSTNQAVEERPATMYTKSVETVSLAWDTRDNPLISRRGHFIGITASESGAFYRTDFRWWRAKLNARALYPVNRFTVLAGKAEWGTMGPLHDSPATPIEERFYLGGATTVRGWKRNYLSPRTGDNIPVGGDISFYATAELRRNVWGPVTLTVFADAGNVWISEREWQPFDLFPSGGAGLLFLTPVGPMRIDYAKQLRKNPYGDNRTWTIDFSLGTTF